MPWFLGIATVFGVAALILGQLSQRPGMQFDKAVDAAGIGECVNVLISERVKPSAEPAVVPCTSPDAFVSVVSEVQDEQQCVDANLDYSRVSGRITCFATVLREGYCVAATPESANFSYLINCAAAPSDEYPVKLRITSVTNFQEGPGACPEDKRRFNLEARGLTICGESIT